MRRPRPRQHDGIEQHAGDRQGLERRQRIVGGRAVFVQLRDLRVEVLQRGRLPGLRRPDLQGPAVVLQQREVALLDRQGQRQVHRRLHAGGDREAGVQRAGRHDEAVAQRALRGIGLRQVTARLDHRLAADRERDLASGRRPGRARRSLGRGCGRGCGCMQRQVDPAVRASEDVVAPCDAGIGDVAGLRATGAGEQGQQDQGLGQEMHGSPRRVASDSRRSRRAFVEPTSVNNIY